MNWYLVKLVYKIQTSGKPIVAEFDEQYRLIQASNEEEALTKAKIIGVKNESTYESQEGLSVSWIFIDTAFVRPLEELSDGVELFSTTVSSEHPEEYISFVHHQAEITFKRMTPHAVMTD